MEVQRQLAHVAVYPEELLVEGLRVGNDFVVQERVHVLGQPSDRKEIECPDPRPTVRLPEPVHTRERVDRVPVGVPRNQSSIAQIQGFAPDSDRVRSPGDQVSRIPTRMGLQDVQGVDHRGVDGRPVVRKVLPRVQHLGHDPPRLRLELRHQRSPERQRLVPTVPTGAELAIERLVTRPLFAGDLDPVRKVQRTPQPPGRCRFGGVHQGRDAGQPDGSCPHSRHRLHQSHNRASPSAPDGLVRCPKRYRLVAR